MKVNRIYPLWLFWLIPSSMFLVLGGVSVANQYGLSYLPHLLLFIQLAFIIYCFVPRKDRKENLNEKDVKER